MNAAARLNRWALGAVASAVLIAGLPMSSARAQAVGAEEEPAVAVETVVAKALIDRGMKLFRAGDFAYARTLFIEALERDPKGPHAGSALALLRQANAKLGRYKDDGVPKEASGQPADTVIDPYAGGGDAGGGDDGVLDPYAGGGDTGGGETGGGDDGVLDPYAGGGETGGGEAGGGDDTVLDPYAAGGPAKPASEGTPRDTRRELLVWSGSVGFLAGLGVAGDSDGAGLYGLLGAGGGVGLAYWLTSRFDLSQGQVSAVETAGTWGALNLAFLGHLIDGTDSEYTYEEAVRYASVGGLIGIAAGTLWARRGDPDPDHLAFANSMAAYGAVGGLLLGVAIDPPEDEAYTLNAAIGSAIGLAGGLYFADKVDMSRRRTLKMDLGAALGAGAPWALLYPLIDDDTTNADEQTVGVISVLTMGGGAYLAWRLTRGDTREGDASAPPPVAALARRNFAGAWSLGVPIPRPMEHPLLAPPTGAFNLGVDLLGGQF